jgi:hypothetical protein
MEAVPEMDSSMLLADLTSGTRAVDVELDVDRAPAGASRRHWGLPRHGVLKEKISKSTDKIKSEKNRFPEVSALASFVMVPSDENLFVGIYPLASFSKVRASFSKVRRRIVSRRRR